MEVFVVIMLIILMVIVVNGFGNQRNQIATLSQEIAKLSSEINKLQKTKNTTAEISSNKKSIEDRWSVKPIATAINDEIPIIKPVNNPIDTIAATPDKQPIAEPIPTYISAKNTDLPSKKIEPTTAFQHVKEPAYQESWYDKWVRNNPDLEKFIGENLINKIGIAVLVLGIAFFVKYAIDQNWINEIGRVSIGILCGTILVGIAHYLRNNYRAFSSVLAGGGIAVYYFTIAFAFHQYALLSQTSAFSIMVVITAFSVLLSLFYNKMELAIIACLGGFLTPFLVSKGDGNYMVLFSYLTILNIGLLALAYKKRWLPINIIALVFTALIYGGWLATNMHKQPLPYQIPIALLFATIFYLLFLGINMVYQINHKLDFKALDFSVLLMINALYFSVGLTLLHEWYEGDYQGVFTLSLGIVNCILAYWFFKRQGTDTRLLYLLIGLTLTFLTLTIPIQLKGHAITLFWSAEFVLLFWMYQRSSIKMFRYSSQLIMILAFISIFQDWTFANQSAHHIGLIFLDIKGMVSNIVLIAALAAYTYLLKKEEQSAIFYYAIDNEFARRIFMIAATIVTYLTLIYGVNLLFMNEESLMIPNVYHQQLTYLLTIVLLLKFQKKTVGSYFLLLCSLFAFSFFYYLYSIQYTCLLREAYINNLMAPMHWYFHYLSIGLCLTIFILFINYLRKHTLNKQVQQIIFWSIPLALVFMFSIEIGFIYLNIEHGKTSDDLLKIQYQKAGLTIIWTVSSFLCMWLGMKHQTKTLRIISLSLFAIVLLKLFLYDIKGISEGGKIAAFILLGVLLLVVSFMYQKLKKIILDDQEK